MKNQSGAKFIVLGLIVILLSSQVASAAAAMEDANSAGCYFDQSCRPKGTSASVDNSVLSSLQSVGRGEKLTAHDRLKKALPPTAVKTGSIPNAADRYHAAVEAGTARGVFPGFWLYMKGRILWEIAGSNLRSGRLSGLIQGGGGALMVGFGVVLGYIGAAVGATVGAVVGGIMAIFG